MEEDIKKKVGVGFGVMLMKENKILLGQRNVDPEKADSALNGAGTWTMPGGKLEFGETLEEGATREVKEETGIELKKVEVMCVNNEIMDQAHFVTIGLYCDEFTGEAMVMEPDEITRWQWFGLDEIPSPIYFPSLEVLENYRQKKFYIEEHNLTNSHN
jgi:8-oxo-dGTP diphosphatase